LKLISVFIGVNSWLKGFVLFIRPGLFLSFLSQPCLFISNLIQLSRWICKHNRKDILNDFYLPIRNYANRYKLYENILDREKLREAPITYLEFGVCGGYSFRWWVDGNKNEKSRFYGFDTFEGLPESWGTFKKGEMTANMPKIDGLRHGFVQGLFQDTLNDFLKEHDISQNRLILHLDADLFSSTLFVLTSLAPYLKEGDIMLFDEFNVPNHEFYAFNTFVKSFYIKYELIAAVNNFYQVAIKISK